MSSSFSTNDRRKKYCTRHINRLVSVQRKRQHKRLNEIRDRFNEGGEDLSFEVDDIALEQTSQKIQQNNMPFYVEPPKLNKESTIFNEQIFEDIESTNYSSLTGKLANWAVTCNIAHSHLNMLLKILLEENLDVPLCSKTLLKTPGTCDVIPVEPGQYCHLGLESGIASCFKDIDVIPEVMRININIDGLPISETASFWPILANIVGLKEIFVVGAYHGKQKPTDVTKYLEKFIDDINKVHANGIILQGKRVEVVLNNIICDAPAKAYVLCVKGHNAAVGCNKCTTEGTYMQNCMTFPDIDSPLRTDSSFRKHLHEDYHKGVSPLERINDFDFIKQIPLDYMHLVLLGVTRKVLMILSRGKMGSRMLPDKKEEVNRRIASLNRTLPNSIFSRKPRDLDSVDKWKATEFRLFLIYTGPFILDGILENEQYNHFLYLHVAIRILCHPYLSQQKDHLENADKLLRHFVEEFGCFYGENSITYNVHNLVHLTGDVMLHGPLDSFSAFPFENHMKQIKKSVRNSNFQLQQLVKRTVEKRQNQNKGRTTEIATDLLYRVVEFNDKKVEAVPKSWINEEDPNNVTCAWPPPTKNFLSLVKAQTLPSKDWTNERCQVLQCYATLLEARRKTKKLENDQPSSCDEFGRGCRKVKPVAASSSILQLNSACSGYNSPSSSSTCSELQNEESFNVESRVRNKKSLLPDSEVDVCEPAAEKIQVLYDVTLNNTPTHSRYQQPGFVSSYGRKTLVSRLTPVSAADKTLTPVVTPIPDNDLLNKILLAVDGVSGRMEAIEIQQQLLLEEVAQLRVEIQQNAKGKIEASNAYAIDGSSTLEVLPLKTIKEITDFDEELNEEEILQQYVSHLKLFVCARLDDSVRKCLSSVYTNELAIQCAWTGAKNNFKVKDLKQIGIIEGVIRKYHVTLTKDTFKTHASNWFRRASTRVHRKQRNEEAHQ